MHGGAFEGVWLAWIAHGVGDRMAGDGRAPLGISRLHEYRADHAHRPSGVGCARTEAPRLDSESDARNSAAQLSSHVRVAGRPCRVVLACAAESRRDVLGRAARWT